MVELALLLERIHTFKQQMNVFYQRDRVYNGCWYDRFYDGILGINKTEVIERFITSLPQRHVVPNEGRSILSGVVIDLDKEGKTKHIERILINDDHPFSTF